MKRVQISEELFIELVKYHLLGVEENAPAIKKGLQEKMDAIVRHELYSTYKTAPTKEEQEKARKEYLDKKGIKESFRW